MGDSFQVYEQDLISSQDFHDISIQLREFFVSKGFIEVPSQARLSILAACEDPSTVQTFNFEGAVWPLPQTGQMWLEYELLSKPDAAGYFCASTSYRDEPNPIPGRHKKIFPMFEFEMRGGLAVLRELERDLIAHLGIAEKSQIQEGKYLDVAAKYNVKMIEHEQEMQLYKDYGNAFLLSHFPQYTSPFWNMRTDGDISRKIDVILCGQETIGSAERAVDRDEMHRLFHSISNGGYAQLLYDKFGQSRVEKELDAYLAFDFFQRSGAGIGVTRLINAVKAARRSRN